jgi:hypothetical protein
MFQIQIHLFLRQMSALDNATSSASHVDWEAREANGLSSQHTEGCSTLGKVCAFRERDDGRMVARSSMLVTKTMLRKSPSKFPAKFGYN